MEKISLERWPAGMSEDDFAAAVDRITGRRAALQLFAELLQEQHAVYREKNAYVVIRMRAYLFRAVTATGTDRNCLRFILDELENGDDPWLVGSAARALRTYAHPEELSAESLMQALYRRINNDQFFSYQGYYQQHPLVDPVNAVQELAATIGWLGSYGAAVLPQLERLLTEQQFLLNNINKAAINAAIEQLQAVNAGTACCTPRRSSPALKDGRRLGSLQFEDHFGRRYDTKSLFGQKTSLVVFFYSRCENPVKCSLTMHRLAELQKLCIEGPASAIQLLAITYDPVYDDPGVLSRYAEQRGLDLRSNALVLRTLGPVSDLQEQLNLSVNYAGAVVNRHALELFIAGPDGRILAGMERQRLNPGDLYLALSRYAGRTVARRIWQNGSRITRTIWSYGGSLLVFLLPKCPFCFAIYLSMAGLAGSTFMPYYKYLLPLVLLICSINLCTLLVMARRRRFFIPFICSLAGSLLIIFGTREEAWKLLDYPGISFLLAGALANLFPQTARKLIHHCIFKPVLPGQSDPFNEQPLI
jgi:protein SCO1/2